MAGGGGGAVAHVLGVDAFAGGGEDAHLQADLGHAFLLLVPGDEGGLESGAEGVAFQGIAFLSHGGAQLGGEFLPLHQAFGGLADALAGEGVLPVGAVHQAAQDGHDLPRGAARVLGEEEVAGVLQDFGGGLSGDGFARLRGGVEGVIIPPGGGVEGGITPAHPVPAVGHDGAAQLPAGDGGHGFAHVIEEVPGLPGGFLQAGILQGAERGRVGHGIVHQGQHVRFRQAVGLGVGGDGGI